MGRDKRKKEKAVIKQGENDPEELDWLIKDPWADWPAEQREHFFEYERKCRENPAWATDMTVIDAYYLPEKNLTIVTGPVTRLSVGQKLFDEQGEEFTVRWFETFESPTWQEVINFGISGKFTGKELFLKDPS